jgi:uncharacterized membrane protein
VSGSGYLAQGSRWLIAIGVLGAVLAAVFGLAVTVGFAIDFVIRDSHPTTPVPAGPLALSAVALAVLSISGYLGGMLAYHYGVRVADETTQAEGY